MRKNRVNTCKFATAYELIEFDIHDRYEINIKAGLYVQFIARQRHC